MKTSYKWLQTYFDKKLPSTEKLAEAITFHLCEIDGIEKVSGDEILDVKVLPDRGHYLLSHRGVACEISAILNLPLKKQETKDFKLADTRKLSISISDPKLCRRYIGRVVENVTVSDSPKWMQERLVAIGQRPINNIVDIANYVMFDLGQPLHAFDADKVRGNISVRLAKVGEKISTLDGKDLNLDPETLIIADDFGPLAIAGIKGGKRAEVDANTKNLILESANFDPVSVRKTAQRLGIQTDASKRFENEISPEICGVVAMEEFSALLSEFGGKSVKIGPVVDEYPNKAEKRQIEISSDFINSVLGQDISIKEIENIFKRLSFEYKVFGNNFIIDIPYQRLDLETPENIIEEVGRIHGYENIEAILPEKTKSNSKLVKTFYWTERIKDILVNCGFSEVITSSFSNKGDIEILKPLADDKKFLRTNLSQNILKSLDLNAHNAAILALDEVKIFAVGSVFPGLEKLSLGIGVRNVKKDKKKEADKVSEIVHLLTKELKTDVANYTEFNDGVCEIDLGGLIQKLPEPESYDDVYVPDIKVPVKYSPISIYPFILRDVAVFTPEGTEAEDVLKIIKKEGTNLLVKTHLFDVFRKPLPDGTVKISYAYNLVFQSQERTLSDGEINEIMKKITDSLNSQNGWQVR